MKSLIKRPFDGKLRQKRRDLSHGSLPRCVIALNCLCISKVSVDGCFGEAIFFHQVFDKYALPSPLFHSPTFLIGEFLLPTESYAAPFGFLNTFHLSFCPDFRFELSDSAEHIKQQAARSVSGIDALI